MPAQHVVAGAPPTLILIGTEDYVLSGCKDFAAAMKQVGNQCELKLYEGRAHGFFNVNRGRKDFLATLVDADRFLASLGILKGSPTADEYFKNVRPR